MSPEIPHCACRRELPLADCRMYQVPFELRHVAITPLALMRRRLDVDRRAVVAERFIDVIDEELILYTIASSDDCCQGIVMVWAFEL